MRRFIFITALLSLFLLAIMAVSAQDNTAFTNDPATHENANACYDGGTMAGKCNDDSNGDGFVSDEEIAWAWTCGWYIIRYNSAIFNRVEVPATCQILLPDETPVPNDTSLAVNGVISITGCIFSDCDNDGIPDAYELLYYPDLSNDENSDTDGDGCNLLCEYTRGTLPV